MSTPSLILLLVMAATAAVFVIRKLVTPRAYLGLRPGNQVALCAWCPTKERQKADRYVARWHAGRSPTHTLCPRCSMNYRADFSNSQTS